MRGSCIVSPLVGSRAVPATLRCSDHAARIWEQRFGNQLLTDSGAIGIRRIDEIDAQPHGTAQNRNRLSAIFGWAPDAIPGKAHRAEPEAMYGNFPAQRNTPSQTRRYFFCVHDFLLLFSFTSDALGRHTTHAAPPSEVTSLLRACEDRPRCRESDRRLANP